MSARDFINAAINNLEFESHSTVLKSILDWASVALNVYSPYKFRAPLEKQMFEVVLKLLTSKTWSPNILLILKSKLLGFCDDE